MKPDVLVYVAGHRGLVGSAIVRRLQQLGNRNLVLRTSSDLDLRNQAAVEDFFGSNDIEIVYLVAAKVGGILANNTHPASFIYDNLAIQTNVIHTAYRFKVKKLLFLGSSCIYPKLATQPITEDSLLTGPLEPTNEWYALAKIAGIKMCQAYNHQYGTRFICAMPTNLYGPNDNFNLDSSHVVPALIRKFHEAKVGAEPYVTVWGTGSPKREFLHVDDLADACVFLMDRYDDSAPINVGTGEDLSISELADLIKEVVGYQGAVRFDHTKPDGTPRKLLDVSRIRDLGWKPSYTLEQGIRQTYEWYVNSLDSSE
ncbi:MAG: GDP-L-fucose synthase [Eubacteriales bacterium]|nr:GDP-L-fucose synthase [Eubacteriales bacterium]